MMDLAQTSTGLDELAEAVRGVVHRELGPAHTARAVARAIEPALLRQDLLSEPQMEGDEQSYRQHVLHVEPDGSFSVVALVWLPGQRTPVHDHVSWCVVGVYQGAEAEVRYRLVAEKGQRYLVPGGRATNPVRSSCGFAPPGDIHEVWNSTGGKTISIHIYGADISRLGSSIRRCYDFPVRAEEVGQG